MVTEAVDGLIAASGGRLARLDGYPHIRVAVRNDWDQSKVALVSSGGSGHEPAHAGFVGPGMLAVAICGDVFASPSVDAVLAGITAVTGPAGCLLIVKNYTGDRLNFGLAAERARVAGLKVEVVDVNDDVALPDLPQARGVAGTLLVHKIAGALAAKLEADLAPGKYVALLNNLGGTSMLEMSVLMNELATSTMGSRILHVIGPASMMTSLDMRGFSVSVFPADAEELALLSQETPLAAWPGVSALKPVTVLPLNDRVTASTPHPSSHTPTENLLRQCCEGLIAAENDLNALDARSGDGDTGSTLAGAARSLIAAMDRLPLAESTQLYRAISVELSQTMGGSSGVLLAIFFAAASDGSASGLATHEALKAGLARMQEVGGARLGDRTMIDALAPALDALETGVAEAAQAARAGADYTASITKAGAGRSAYVNAQQLMGHTDPGAEAVARIFECAASCQI